MIQNQAALWQCFHDGSWTKIEHVGECVYKFILEISYLSESMFGKDIPFEIHLENVQVLTYTKLSEPEETITEPETISSLAAEILYANIKGDFLQIDCSQGFGLGGILLLSYDRSSIFASGQEISLKQLVTGANKYWDDFSKKER